MIEKLSHEEIVVRRAQSKPAERFPVFGLLNNIRSLYNVGSMFRTADGANLGALYLSGITGIPPGRAISKTALGAEEEVPWRYVPSALEAVRELKRAGTQILVLEQTHSSVSYADVELRFPCCLVVGNEITGVDGEIASLADRAIEIPMYGMKNSLNVAVAFGIVAYEMVKKYKEYAGDR